MLKNKALLAALPMLLLSGCMQFELTAEELMRPPALNQEQLAISTALEQAVGDSSIKYKYPETGEHRSAFLFHDLDSDGEDEALVFYQAASKGSSTWLNVLDHRGEQWVSVYDIASPNGETEVDFISFQPLLSAQENMVIGWTDEHSGDKCAVIYSYDGAVLEENYSEYYDKLTFYDLNRDGLLDLSLVLCDPYYEECVVSFVIQNRDITGEVSLECSSTLYLPYGDGEVVSLQVGMVDNSTPALFIDNQINLGRNLQMYVSQVVTAYGGDLVNLLDSDDTSLSETTMRHTRTLCQDINGDGIMEVPTVSPLPGYEEDEDDTLYLTTFNRLGVGRTWIPVGHCAINEDHRYMVKIPEKWLNNVTILSLPESSEWSFVRFEETLEDSYSLLLKLKVYSVKDYHDKFESGYFELLGTQGLFEYHAHIPENPEEELSVTSEEVKEMFTFID